MSLHLHSARPHAMSYCPGAAHLSPKSEIIIPMAKTATKAAARKKPAKSSEPAPKAAKLGDLPVWNLNDLYPGIDSLELKRDLEKADADCAAFEKDFKGRLAELAAAPGAAGLLE